MAVPFSDFVRREISRASSNTTIEKRAFQQALDRATNLTIKVFQADAARRAFRASAADLEVLAQGLAEFDGHFKTLGINVRQHKGRQFYEAWRVADRYQDELSRKAGFKTQKYQELFGNVGVR